MPGRGGPSARLGPMLLPPSQEAPRRMRFPALAALLAVVLTAGGCTTNRAPRFDMASGEPEQIRRYTNRPAVDYIFRFDHRAFDRNDGMVDTQLTPDKIDVLQRHGQPEYVRRNIRSRRGDVFDEWAYNDRNTLVQFIAGELVYEGPLMDSDRVLIERGYPSFATFQQYEEGPVREIWIYSKMFAVREQVYSFSDGNLVYRANY